jgi:hypothetical protein
MTLPAPMSRFHPNAKRGEVESIVLPFYWNHMEIASLLFTSSCLESSHKALLNFKGGWGIIFKALNITKY